MKAYHKNQTFAAIVLALLMLPFAVTSSPAQSDSRTFPETGKSVKGKFLQYWDGNGGLPQQGFPISDEMQEKSDTDGKTYTVQYFERAVFEMHPENVGTKYEVLLSLLGSFYYQEKYPSGASDQKVSTENAIKFNETGKSMGGIFRQYWEKNGGLAQQGFPISEEFQEKNDLDGKTYTVQYFERAVFEAHPENAAPYNVLLSQLGTFRYRAKYQTVAQPTAPSVPTSAPVEATPTTAAPTATLPPAPPLRDVEFIGKVEDSAIPFQGPVGITTDAQDNLYVADATTARIVKFDSTGNKVMQFGSLGSEDGQFRFGDVGDLSVDGQGTIYVADTLNARIQKFDGNGNFLAKWGSAGAGEGQFGRALGVAADNQGNVYAIDDRFNFSEAGRIQKFDSNGRFLLAWRGMQNPGYIAADANGDLYMAGYVSYTVKKYDSSGNLLSSWPTTPLTYPSGVGVDSQGDIFVVSGFPPVPNQSTGYFVAKHNQVGQVLAKWGSAGTGDGQFGGGCDVAVDSQGNIYVSDYINKTIQKFRLK